MTEAAKVFLAVLGAAAVILTACSEENDILDLDKVLSGNVSNNSGITGTVIVEIEHNLRDIADPSGNWAISVHSEYFVDSLYAWVDVDGDKAYDPGEHEIGTDPDGYTDALFDGRYVYFVPFENGIEAHCEVLRYDTVGVFDEASSWEVYDPKSAGVGVHLA